MNEHPTQPLIFSLLDTPAFGGAEQYLLSHLYYLAAQGYPVLLATNCPAVSERIIEENRQRQPQNRGTITQIRAPYRLDAIGNWKGLIKYFLALPWALAWCMVTVFQLRRQQPVIALLPGFSDRLTFSPIIKLLRCVLIWIEIGPLEPTFKKNWGFPKLLYRWTQSLPDHFLTTSKFTRQSMVTTGRILPGDITLVYPGITPIAAQQLSEYQHRGQTLRRQAGWGQARVVGFTGRLASENQVELVIKAIALLHKEPGPENVKLLIIGDGPEKARYQRLVRELGLTNHVKFTGFVTETDKFSWLASLDVFVFTRAWNLDGFGMTTIEAMSVSTAVVTPAFGPQLEIITHGQTGLHFIPNNIADLGKQVRALLSNQKLRHKIARNGYNHVQATFNQVQQLKLMHDTLEEYR